MKITDIKELIICGTPYDVEFLDEGEMLFDSNHDRVCGLINYDESKMSIIYREKKEETLKTLIHEILHAISESHCLNLSEKLVRTLSTELTAIITNNNKILQTNKLTKIGLAKK